MTICKQSLIQPFSFIIHINMNSNSFFGSILLIKNAFLSTSCFNSYIHIFNKRNKSKRNSLLIFYDLTRTQGIWWVSFLALNRTSCYIRFSVKKYFHTLTLRNSFMLFLIILKFEKSLRKHVCYTFWKYKSSCDRSFNLLIL